MPGSTSFWRALTASRDSQLVNLYDDVRLEFERVRRVLTSPDSPPVTSTTARASAWGLDPRVRLKQLHDRFCKIISTEIPQFSSELRKHEIETSPENDKPQPTVSTSVDAHPSPVSLDYMYGWDSLLFQKSTSDRQVKEETHHEEKILETMKPPTGTLQAPNSELRQALLNTHDFGQEERHAWADSYNFARKPPLFLEPSPPVIPPVSTSERP
ncbi:hypothetical protein QBC35DRAFT_464077 [Podospora australis]|uniref:Uncharacterized protein n=1 Tax=Podospora australis TaxID=1536484 RepID=A0AAN7AH86_9PEZI|nr:hypothetical protein QBC35DRAFT_464077 [Podospora australis]